MAYFPPQQKHGGGNQNVGHALNRIFAHLQGMGRQGGGLGQGAGPGIAGEIAPRSQPFQPANIPPHSITAQPPMQPPHPMPPQPGQAPLNPQLLALVHHLLGNRTAGMDHGQIAPGGPGAGLGALIASNGMSSLIGPHRGRGGVLGMRQAEQGQGVPNDAVHLGNGLIYSPTHGYINLDNHASNGPF